MQSRQTQPSPPNTQELIIGKVCEACTLVFMICICIIRDPKFPPGFMSYILKTLANAKFAVTKQLAREGGTSGKHWNT